MSTNNKYQIVITLNDPEEIQRFEAFKKRQKIRQNAPAGYKALFETIERDEQSVSHATASRAAPVTEPAIL